MEIREILKSKRGSVVTIAQEATVREALDTLCEHRIGALPVVDAGGTLVGILSERDLLFLYQKGADPDTITVQAAMTHDVIIGLPTDSVQGAMHTMTEHRIRHLPIMDGERLAGMVSIGDVVKALRTETESEARFLRAYFTGLPV